MFLASTDNYYYEPKRGMRFVLRFVFTGLAGEGGLLLGQGNAGYQTALAIATLSAARPSITMNSTQTDRIHEKFNIIGKPTWTDMSVTFYDYEDANSASEIMWRWTLAQYNPQTGTMGYCSEYKADANLVMLSPKGTIIENWSVRGIYPDGFPSSEVNYSSGDPIQLSVTFKFDWAMKDQEIPGPYVVPLFRQ